MASLNDVTRKAFEDYLLGNKEAAFSKLIPGTSEHYYLTIIDEMKTSKGQLKKETRELFEKYTRNFYEPRV